MDSFNILSLINEKLIYNIDNNDKLALYTFDFILFQEWKNKIMLRCRCRYRSAMSFIIFSFESKARSKSQHDLRRRISKHRKGRAFKGTRARKSRLVSRSSPMLFLPFVRITSPVCFPTRGPHANARSLVHVKICRVWVYVAYVYTRVRIY